MAADGTFTKTCPLCEAMCGLRVEVADGRVAKVRPNPDDVWSRGYSCPKGIALGELHHDPDRVRQPLVRRGGELVETTWEEALAEVERGLRGVIDAHGLDAVTAYIGNPTAHNWSLSRYVGAFIAMSGLQQTYSAGTIDQWPKNVSSALLFGGMWSFPVPDLDRCDYLLLLGANPHASQGSLLACPDVLGRLDGIRERGGKVVVVDPRRTGTADHADGWLAIRPGGDAAFLMGVLNVLFTEGLADPGSLVEKVVGLDELEALAGDFPPEAVAGRAGIEADTIRRVARELAAAPRAAVYGRIGTCNQEFGTLASWLVDAVNVVTGNLDREGGAMFAKPLAWSLTSLRPPDFAEGYAFQRWRTRVRGAPEVLGQVPVSCLAEEIATPGEGQLRALITIAGNPVLSAPEGDRLDSALEGIDFMVSLDNWLNETTRHADVVLPGASVLEQPHYDEMLWSWAVRSAGKYSRALFEPAVDEKGERREEWELLLTLAAILQGQKVADVDVAALDQLYFAGLAAGITMMPGSRIEGREPSEIVAATPGRGPARLLDFQLRTGPWGECYGGDPEGLTLEKLAAEPDGLDFGPMAPRLDEVLTTPSGKVELVHPYLVADLPRLQQSLGDAAPDLVLVSRRHVRSNNSWMHNAPSLMTGKDRCTLLVHPDDAAARGLAPGAAARVRSDAGEVEVPVEISDEMRPGVVCLPHGWGHDKPGAKLSVASQRAGVCNNVLAPGTLVDPPSGNAIVNGIPVEVAPA